MHVVYNSATNRQTGDVADANGNVGSGYSYDIENRLLKAGTGMPQYGYDAGNKRIERDTEFTFWAGNQKWATYTAAVSGSAVTFTLTGTNVYFGGRLIAKGTYNSGGTNDKITLTALAQDRLGSMNGKFYPFGQERPSATTNDKEKFTGYFRDTATGLDYADQRYEQPAEYYQGLANQYINSVSLLQPLQDEGLIDEYSVDFFSGAASIALDTSTFSLIDTTQLEQIARQSPIQIRGPLVVLILVAVVLNDVVEWLKNRPRVLPDDCPPDQRQVTPSNSPDISWDFFDGCLVDPATGQV